ncbi:TauD/TfdA family dioxygenase [Peterkaempfera sp. SMS 1(5)a]|uniref:TauD/TfdA family dioxygenase n=1 Tax=Peterkaempfera podocarpi TaxID=3232308 RepID=UPI0036700376
MTKIALDWQVVPGKPATAQAPDFADIAEACDWLGSVGGELSAALHEHGALYLRGLPITRVDDFAAVRDRLIPAATPYREKATPRSDFGQGVFSSTDLPAPQRIQMHNENSYTLTFPGLLVFSCLTAPDAGGATPVADCRRVLRTVPEELARKMRAVGWQLTRTYSDHLSTDWRTAFSSQDQQVVERYCADNLISHEWQQDGNLRTRQLRPGVINHPDTGDEVWFNHLAFWNEWALDEDLREVLVDEFGPGNLPFNTAFGDGEPLTKADLDAVRAAYDEATVRETWQVGDLLLVDNILTAHGRDPYQGDRKIVVAMGNPVELAACRPTVEAGPSSF